MPVEGMKRVNRNNPCPVCGKPDWCLTAPDNSAAICARIEEGSIKKCREAGYLHILRNRHNRHNGHKSSANWRRVLKSVSIGKEQSIDFGQLARRYQQHLRSEKLAALADSLGVSTQSLSRLGVGWDGEAYTFPMSNDFGNIIGIRRRFPNGRKVSVKGSKNGLFIPGKLSADGFLLVCEGITDTAAALYLGFSAIGRPNCNSRIDLVLRYVRGRDVVIVGDNDYAGKAGAEKLAAKLALCCSDVRIVYPPAPIKDLRAWLRAGLTAEDLNRYISGAEPVRTKIRFKCICNHVE
ncbi:hypothetical protein ACFL3Q_13810 [Planctomycetota bacterium]